jgi:hypothetical protein
MSYGNGYLNARTILGGRVAGVTGGRGYARILAARHFLSNSRISDFKPERPVQPCARWTFCIFKTERRSGLFSLKAFIFQGCIGCSGFKTEKPKSEV